MDIHEAVEFFGRLGSFRCRDFARSVGMSRQAALEHLKRAVNAGWLVVEGVGRGTRYRGADRGEGLSPSESFWSRLELATPSLRYVNLLQAIGPECRRKTQGASVFIGDPTTFVILNAAGITLMTHSFAQALVRWKHSGPGSVEVINASAHVARLIARAEEAWRRRPASDYST